MSRVESALAEAHRRQRRRLAGGALALALLALLAAGAATLSGGGVSVEVVVEPPAARAVAAVEIVEGHGISPGHRVWALPGPLRVRVSAEGFLAETVPVGAGARARGRIDVLLRERPTLLRARADPALDGVVWVLDGASVGAGAVLETEIPPGEHVLEALHPHRGSASAAFAAERAGETELALTLPPLAGRIAVASVPPGAAVTLDGRDAGATPVVLDAEGGVHELRLELEGHGPAVRVVEVTRDAPEIEVEVALAPVDAFVTFVLSPAGGDLSVDGAAVDAAAAAQGVPLAAGAPLAVRYAAPGHAPAETELALAPGERRTVELAARPVLGAVEVRAEPPAEIEVNGTPAGTTPLRLELPAAPQEIRISRRGFRAETRTITPDPAETQIVEAALRPEAEARLAEAPEQYANSAGVTLKLFRTPGRITLGTPRGEPGRRANEFLRTVALARPFYVGVTEVTVEQYLRFAQPDAAPSSPNRLPVTGISWEDAARFCNWLSLREGLIPVYRFVDGRHAGSDPGADGYRLPTEAEWEWLARRAGRARATRFPWGDGEEIPAGAGNLADESARGAVPVYVPGYNDGFAGLADAGSFSANAAGLHDLAGNASEWTHDIYLLEPPSGDSVAADAPDPAPGRHRTVKGSSWRSGTLGELRAAWRDTADGPQAHVGFRIARYLAPEP